MLLPLIQKGAIIDGVYRYLLWRTWNPEHAPVTFIMGNPSTADGQSDDPTLRRCLGFAHSWGFGGLLVVNAFAYRSPSPQDLFRVADPVGPKCDEYLIEIAKQSACLVVAWGQI